MRCPHHPALGASGTWIGRSHEAPPRNVIEPAFCPSKDVCRVAARYDKLAVIYRAVPAGIGCDRMHGAMSPVRFCSAVARLLREVERR